MALHHEAILDSETALMHTLALEDLPRLAGREVKVAIAVRTVRYFRVRDARG